MTSFRARARTTRVAALAAASLLAVAGFLLAAPRQLIEQLDRRSPAVFSVRTERPVLALTLDDGPSEHTPEILDLLADHGVQATFFLIGERVAERPDLVRRIVAAGHELGNHTMEDRPSVLLDDEAFGRSLARTDALLSRHGDPRWFRPGAGWYDDDIVARARAEGYRIALASMLPLDAWLPFPPVVSEYVEFQARPGAVLVLHDGPETGARTIEVLRRVLPGLAERYRVTTLTGLVGPEE